MVYNLQRKDDYENIIVAYVEGWIRGLIVGNNIRVILDFFSIALPAHS
jgi:hypothetical protein